MTFSEFLTNLANQRAEQLSKKLNGVITGEWEYQEGGLVLTFQGHYHDDGMELVWIGEGEEEYQGWEQLADPTDWSFHKIETVSEVIKHLGLSTTLTQS